MIRYSHTSCYGNSNTNVSNKLFGSYQKAPPPLAHLLYSVSSFPKKNVPQSFEVDLLSQWHSSLLSLTCRELVLIDFKSIVT